MKNKFVAIALALTTLVWALPISAATTAEIQANINLLLQQISALQTQIGVSSNVSPSYTFTRDLTVGSEGVDVTALQQILISGGYLNISAPTGYFGLLTRAAVSSWQAAKGISPTAGYFGPLSRATIVVAPVIIIIPVATFPIGCTSAAGFSSTTGLSCSLVTTYPAGCTSAVGYSSTTGLSCATVTTYPAGCTSAVGYSITTGLACSVTTTTTVVVTSGAGNISDFKKDSTYSAVEVKEGAVDTKVVGFTVKADSGSDLTIQTLDLDLQRTGGAVTAGSTNITHYFNSVSIWEGDTRIATVNAADFTKIGTTYSKNISLSGAVVRANQTNEFYITVNAAANIDSADLGHNVWTATVQSLRYVDGTGAVISDSATGDLAYAQTFSFESLAAAGSQELKVSLTTGQDLINKAHTVLASTTGTTADVILLAFDIKATGDIKNITDIPIGVSTASTSTVAGIASTFTLWKDGVKIDTIDVSEGTIDIYTGATSTLACLGATANDGCGIHFDNIDFDLADGSTTHFVVKASIKKIGTSTFAEGDSLTAGLNTTAVDAIVAEDINGDSISTTYLVGSATAEAITFRSKGLSVVLVGTPTAVISHAGDIVGSGAGDDDQATFTITFDATASGSDVYVDHTAPALSGGTTATDIDLVTGGTVALTASSITSPGATDGNEGFLVADGTTQRFTVTGVVTVSADGLCRMVITAIRYALTDAEGTTSYTSGLTSFKTANLYMNAN